MLATWSLYARRWIAGAAPWPALPRAVRLAAGEARRFDNPRAPVTLRVAHGTVWVTTTPAEGDAILHAGDSLMLTRGWPIVAQAISGRAALEILDGTLADASRILVRNRRGRIDPELRMIDPLRRSR